jgi:hypothetical protein
MRRTLKTLATAMVATGLALPPFALARTYEEESAGKRFLYTAGALVANVMPVASAVTSPLCLPGYVLCKLSFASLSLLAAAEHLVLGGGANATSARAILHRGFQGDWYVTGRHVAGYTTAQPWPDPPRAEASAGDFEPLPR